MISPQQSLALPGATPGPITANITKWVGRRARTAKITTWPGRRARTEREDYDDEDCNSAGSGGDDDGDNSRDADFVPKLFESSDNDDFDHLNDDDINEEDRRIKNRDSKTRIPTGRRRGNLIKGGPVAPNYKLMSASKASEARSEYQTLRKNYRDGIRRERLRGNKGSSFDESDYTGDLTPTLRPMTLVILSRLKLGQTFPESSLVKLCVAEEANHRGIYFSVQKSDDMRLVCTGEGSFCVHASNSDIGWSITKCEVLVEQGDQPVQGFTSMSTTLPRSPYKVAYVIPLIAKTIAETPMASNKVLHSIVSRMQSYRVQGQKQTKTSHTRTL
jgi:hypothetical protein